METGPETKENRTGQATRGIDVHVHIRTGDRAKIREGPQGPTANYFKRERPHLTPDEVAAYYRSLNLKAVVFDVDAETRTGLKISNDEIAAAVSRNPDTLIGFGSVDPWKGEAAVKEVERCATKLGMRGMKFHPVTQAFFPNGRRFYPIYEACERLNLVALFHTGMCGIGAGTPGGGGIHLKYSRPIPYLDDVAADFPSLKIIAAHPSWPWQEEMLAVARHKGNVFIDLSGWAPKYFPESLVHYADSLLQDRVLFGSDFPLIDTERWLREFAELKIKEEVRKKILLANASSLFGI